MWCAANDNSLVASIFCKLNPVMGPEGRRVFWKVHPSIILHGLYPVVSQGMFWKVKVKLKRSTFLLLLLIYAVIQE